jgi:uncharacterized protein (TIGR03032 family)
MASQRIFIVATPRQGAGLFRELACVPDGFGSTALSKESLIDIVADSTGINDFISHQISDLNLNSDQVASVVKAIQAKANSDLPVTVDYHTSFALNVDLLAKAFPEAKFIYFSRDAVASVASGIVAWQSGEFVTEPELPTWWGSKWSFPLIPSWLELVGEPINEIVAKQTAELGVIALAKLASIRSSGKNNVAIAEFESLLAKPAETIEEVMGALGHSWASALPSKLPWSKTSKSKGANLDATGITELARTGILSHAESFEVLFRALGDLGITRTLPAKDAVPKNSPTNKSTPKMRSQLSEGTPFVAHFTGALPELLFKAKASLVFSAYNSGLVGTVRAKGNSIDTSYINMPKPMGMALSDGKLAISTLDAIRGYRQHNQLARRFAGEQAPDTVFMAQHNVITGQLAVHDMAYGTAPGYEGLWFINSAFSCLSLMDPDFSFIPKWRPSWISSLAFENRCHLNGLAMVKGAPKYVTALSQSNEPQGWRADKGTTGVIVDITTNRIVTSGLSMPHSPRWHNNQLFFLESGKGSLSRVDHRSGEVTTIAILPGFTRGLAFIGHYALVGLSQVRESAFKDLPVTSNKQERNCGIWVVDTRSGQIVSTLKFEGVIQELFEVTVVEDTTWPVFLERTPEMGTAFVLPNEALKNLAQSRLGRS